MPLSTRSARDRTKNELALELETMRAAGRKIFDLTESNPTRASISYPEGVLGSLARPGGLTYDPTPFGLSVAREAVAQTYIEAGVAVDPSRIVLTTSTSEAYAFLFKLLCDDGDDVLVPQPSYPLLDHLAVLEGVRLAPYRLDYDGEWHLDPESLQGALGPRSRAIVTVHPNNPTGSYLKTTEVAALAGTGLPIVSDEVFAPYSLCEDPRRATSALEAEDTLVFALGGLSKMAALPQMKLSWIAVGGPPPEVEEALGRLELIADAFLSTSTPVQLAAPTLLGSRHVAAGSILERLERNLDTLARKVAGTPVSLLRVEGGWYAPLRLPRTKTEEEWVLSLLREDSVYVHPGHFFDFPEEAYVVTSLLSPAIPFDEGIDRLLERVKRCS